MTPPVWLDEHGRRVPTRPALRSLVSLMLACFLLAACARTGDVAGDVYITMRSGDVKRGADVEVFLVSPTTEFEQDWTKAQASFRDDLPAARAAAANAADMNAAQAAVRRIVGQHQINAIELVKKHQMASVRTDVNGHYVKQQLLPGRYYIFSVHRVFDNVLFWFQPIEIRRGETTKLDLTGSNTGWPFDPASVK